MSIVAADADGLKVYRVAKHVDGFLASSTDELTLKSMVFDLLKAKVRLENIINSQYKMGELLLKRKFPSRF